VGDQVMTALQLREGAGFDPTGFTEFLDRQEDIGTKWTPRLVRISDQLPLTPTLKVLKRQLRQERWRCEDPVWWSKTKNAPYHPMAREDVNALEQAIAERQHGARLRRV
jgi:fatty-acyl-CoA synthase